MLFARIASTLIITATASSATTVSLSPTPIHQAGGAVVQLVGALPSYIQSYLSPFITSSAAYSAIYNVAVNSAVQQAIAGGNPTSVVNALQTAVAAVTPGLPSDQRAIITSVIGVVSSKAVTGGLFSASSTPGQVSNTESLVSKTTPTTTPSATPTPSGTTPAPAVSQITSSISPSPTALDVKGDVGGSFNNKQLVPIQDPLLRALVGTAINIPDHFNVSCQTCQSAGTIEVAAGGWSPDSNEIEDAFSNFTKQGWIRVMTRDLNMQFEPVINLLPGFQVVNIEVPVYNKRLSTVNFTKSTKMDFWFAIKLPLVIELHSEVNIFPKVKVDVPNDASIFIDMSKNGIYGGSKQSGFEKTKVTPGFDINAPNLNFTIVEGVNWYLTANASAPKLGDLGKVEVKVKLPQYNSTFSWLNNVNDQCVSPSSGQQSFANALRAQHVGAYDIAWSSDFKGVESGGDIKNDSLTLADGCYTWDLNAKSLKVATSGADGTALGLINKPLLGLVIAVAIAFLI